MSVSHKPWLHEKDTPNYMWCSLPPQPSPVGQLPITVTTYLRHFVQKKGLFWLQFSPCVFGELILRNVHEAVAEGLDWNSILVQTALVYSEIGIRPAGSLRLLTQLLMWSASLQPSWSGNWSATATCCSCPCVPATGPTCGTGLVARTLSCDSGNSFGERRFHSCELAAKCLGTQQKAF